MADPSRSVEHLALLASVVAGRPLEVVNGSGSTWTDGSTIYLSSPERDAVVMQASLVEAGSLDRDLLVRLLGRNRVARRYLLLEGTRALARLHERYPSGSWPQADHVVRTATVEESLRLARSRTPLPSPPAWFGEIRPRATRRAETHAPQEASNAQAETSHDPGARNGDSSARSLLRRDNHAATSAISRITRRLFGGDGEISGHTRGAGVTRHGMAVVADHGDSIGIRLTDPPGGRDVGAVGDDRFVYPEWFAREGAYREAWTTVRVRQAIPGSTEPGVHRDDGLARDLARLGFGLIRERRQPQGLELDMDAVIDSFTEITAGYSSVQHLYIDQLRLRRDLTIALLIDASGSSTSSGSGGRSTFELQRTAAFQLLNALDRLGDETTAFTFSSRGRAAVTLQRIKGLREPCDIVVRRRLAGILPGDYTRLGAAIRHATHVLSDAGAPRRVLMLLSDQHAYDTAYEGLHAIADTTKAIAEARQAGIGCLVLGFDPKEALLRIDNCLGGTVRATAPDIAHMTGHLARLIHEAIQSTTTAEELYS